MAATNMRNLMVQEIVDADAFIGTIAPEQVRAGNLKWVGVMAAGVEKDY